jgi:hypothetical protein
MSNSDPAVEFYSKLRGFKNDFDFQGNNNKSQGVGITSKHEAFLMFKRLIENNEGNVVCRCGKNLNVKKHSVMCSCGKIHTV